MSPDVDAACEAARALVRRYRVAVGQVQLDADSGWTRRREAAASLWDVLEDADALLQVFPEDAPRGEREALITLAEYWHEIEPLDVYQRMDEGLPQPPSLHVRAAAAYRAAEERSGR